MTRNHQRTPATYSDDEAFSSNPPRVLRASRAPRPSAASKPAPRHTDDLDEPITKIPTTHNRRDFNLSNYWPQTKRPLWQICSIGLCCLAGFITITYTILFFIVAGCLSLANLASYGPVHTSYTQTILNGQPTTIQASNVNGAILITLINQDGSAKTYAGPALQASAWNGDLNGIVATADMEQNQITVHLTGGMNYLHLLFARPQMKLQLLPDKQTGYKVVIAS